jgi:acetoin utilization protein AcuB
MMLQTLLDPGTRVDTELFTQALPHAPLRVADIMSAEPVTITPDESVHAARALMQQRQIRHLPVLENNRLVGIVSDRDIQRVLPSPATSLAVWEVHHLLDELTVGEVMTRFVVTVAPHLPVTMAIHRLLRHRIGALPVVAGRQIVGILTRSDVLRAFLRVQEEHAAVA